MSKVLTSAKFVIALNVIEDFLQGEGYKFLRLVIVFFFNNSIEIANDLCRTETRKGLYGKSRWMNSISRDRSTLSSY